MTRYLYCPECRRRLVKKKHPDGQRLPTCPQGHFTKYNNMIATAAALIRRNGKYLAVKRAINPYKGKWDMVGGFSTVGELPAQTIIREVAEETGLRVNPLKIIGIFPSAYGNTGTTTLTTAFECVVTGGSLQLDAENSEAAWFRLAEYPTPPFAGDYMALKELRKQKRKKRHA